MKKKPVDQNKYKKQKVYSYLSLSDVVRLTRICQNYGFKSIYQLIQYLVHCFLRVADPANDPIDEPIPQEIEEMFTNNSDWEVRTRTAGFHDQISGIPEGVYVRVKPDQRKIKTPDDLTP